jgi:hypothetical protein
MQDRSFMHMPLHPNYDFFNILKVNTEPSCVSVLFIGAGRMKRYLFHLCYVVKNLIDEAYTNIHHGTTDR